MAICAAAAVAMGKMRGGMKLSRKGALSYVTTVTVVTRLVVYSYRRAIVQGSILAIFPDTVLKVNFTQSWICYWTLKLSGADLGLKGETKS